MLFHQPAKTNSSIANHWLSAVLLVALVSIPNYCIANQQGEAPQFQPDAGIRAALIRTVNESESFIDRFDAEVWLVDMSARISRYIKNTEDRLEFLKLVHMEATRAELSPELVLSVIHVESLFDRFAISSAGAQGFMQVMPFWKKEIGRPEDNLMSTHTNLRYGCTILKHYLNREKGNLVRALARYNGSLGKTWYPERVMKAWKKHWFVKHI